MEARSNLTVIYVFAHWEGMTEPVLMGELRAEFVRSKEIFSFSYDRDWLKTKFSHMLDPELVFFPGAQYASDERQNFGIFLDSSPDRWGRMLMNRREAVIARSEKRSPGVLRESDYLLGLFDGHRMGALRFKVIPDGPFLNNNKDFASPPWTSIRELEQISLKLEEDGATENPDYPKWLAMLVNSGSSIGGARPKASVIDVSGNLWIAKFPGKTDTKDIGGWEMVANELARSAGINVAQCTARKFSGHRHTFLTKRFDRTDSGERIHFASAMTMLGHKDGDNYREGASYLEIADFLARYGANADKDLKELWTRMVFNIMIANTDDHLRNHGFILTNRGWTLSPAFDINPNEEGTGLSLNVSFEDNELDLDLALGVTDYFRIDRETGTETISKVKKSISNWRRVAGRFQLPGSELDLMSKAFDRFL